MDKLKLVGIGVAIGVVITVLLVRFGATPDKITLGIIEFVFPTVTPTPTIQQTPTSSVPAKDIPLPTDTKTVAPTPTSVPLTNTPRPTIQPTTPTVVPGPVSTTSRPECIAPSGLIPLWTGTTEPPWSRGIWGSSNVPKFAVGVAYVDTNKSAFGEFQIWIDPCSVQWHDYRDGGRFWPKQPNIGDRSIIIPLGGKMATTVRLPANTGVWGLGPPYDK